MLISCHAAQQVAVEISGYDRFRPDALPQRFRILKQPVQLGSRKIGVRNESGHSADLCDLLRCEGAQHRLRPAVLPDDSRSERFTRQPVKEKAGLTFVIKPNAGNLVNSGTRTFKGFLNSREHGLPDLFRIMFNPARMRIGAPDTAVSPSEQAKALPFQSEDGNACSPLINTEVHVTHIFSSYAPLLAPLPSQTKALFIIQSNRRYMQLFSASIRNNTASQSMTISSNG